MWPCGNNTCTFISHKTPFWTTCFMNFLGWILERSWSNLKNKKKFVKKYWLGPELSHFEILGYRQVFCQVSTDGQECNMIGPSGHKLGHSAYIFLPTYCSCQDLSENVHITGSNVGISSWKWSTIRYCCRFMTASKMHASVEIRK